VSALSVRKLHSTGFSLLMLVELPENRGKQLTVSVNIGITGRADRWKLIDPKVSRSVFQNSAMKLTKFFAPCHWFSSF